MSAKNLCGMQDCEAVVKLTGVKKDLYNPHLPTLRRCEMDSVLDKLHDEHCRSTVCGKYRFPDSLYYQYYPPSKHVPGYDLLPLYYKDVRKTCEEMQLSLVMNKALDDRWKAFVQQLPMPKMRVTDTPEQRELHFCNYMLRSLKPEASDSWRKKLKPGPWLDKNGARQPIPGEQLNLFRDSA